MSNSTPIDWSIAVDRLIPAADYRRADDYAALSATWHDDRPLPSEAELIAAFKELAAQSDARKIWPDSAAFLAEFTFPEIAQIALSTDPTIAALSLFMAAWSGEVWSDDERVVAGLDACEAAAIIDAERRDEILAK